MASEAQIEANRRNAKKSTGPKSERGKEAVAGNALRHGLAARKVISFDESEPDFLAFHAEQREAFQPADAVEEHLVERIAMCAWRLRRAYRVEAEMIDGWHNVVKRRSVDTRRIEDLQLGAVFECRPDQMTRLSRYEIALDRALQRAYVMLERRQARRRGEVVPAPITVHVEGEIEGQVEGLAAIHRLEQLRAETENFQTKPILPINSVGEAEDEAKSEAARSGAR